MANVSITEVEQIVQELKEMESEHRDNIPSLFGTNTLHLAKANTYREAIEMLEERLLEGNEG